MNIFFWGVILGMSVSAIPLTPSTTEESVVTSGNLSSTGLNKKNGSATQLQRILPGIDPIAGHDTTSGWL